MRQRREDQPAALLGIGGEPLERAQRVRVRERLHVAHRRSARDAVVEDGCERVELRAQFDAEEAADLDRLGHGSRESRTSGVVLSPG